MLGISLGHLTLCGFIPKYLLLACQDSSFGRLVLANLHLLTIADLFLIYGFVSWGVGAES